LVHSDKRLFVCPVYNKLKPREIIHFYIPLIFSLIGVGIEYWVPFFVLLLWLNLHLDPFYSITIHRQYMWVYIILHNYPKLGHFDVHFTTELFLGTNETLYYNNALHKATSTIILHHHWTPLWLCYTIIHEVHVSFFFCQFLQSFDNSCIPEVAGLYHFKDYKFQCLDGLILSKINLVVCLLYIFLLSSTISNNYPFYGLFLFKKF
jgi:hypothetical protein